MIQEIIASQKAEFERRFREEYVPREIQLTGSDTELVNVVIGPRRAGKSFFLIHTTGILKNAGYVNFDEERLLKVEDFDEIIAAIRVVYNDPKILFFDEIQNVRDWEIIINRLYRQGFKILLTGSNSHLLSSDLATHLTGRHYATYIFPFSFREVLSLFPEMKLPGDIQQKCSEYIAKGGFPEIWTRNYESSAYLSSLFDSVLLKDIVKRYRVRHPNALIDLGQILITNICGEFSVTSIQKLANFNSQHTVAKYLGYLEEAFLLFTIPRFSYKIKKHSKESRKIYCYDNGYYTAKAFRFSPNTGKFYENAVAISLKKEELAGKLRLFYYKNQKQEEVDFVIQQELKVSRLIQVCSSVAKPKVKEREIRSLLKAGTELHCEKMIIITSDYENKEHHSWFGHSGDIEFIPLWKWLLNRT